MTDRSPEVAALEREVERLRGITALACEQAERSAERTARLRDALRKLLGPASDRSDFARTMEEARAALEDISPINVEVDDGREARVAS